MCHSEPSIIVFQISDFHRKCKDEKSLFPFKNLKIKISVNGRKGELKPAFLR